MDDPQTFEDAADGEFTLTQGGFEDRQAAAMVDSTEGLAAVMALSDHGIGVGIDRKQFLKGGGGQPGHIASHDQTALGSGSGKRGNDAGQGTLTYNSVLNQRPAQGPVALARADQGHRTRRVSNHLGDVRHQGHAADRQQSFIAAHPLAAASAQNEPLAHFRMIALCYNSLIRLILTCLSLVLSIALTASAADVARPAKVKTVLRVDPATGRLVRSSYALAFPGPVPAPPKAPVTRIVEPMVIEPAPAEPRSISASGIVAPVPQRRQPANIAFPPAPDRIREIVDEKSKLHGLDPLLVHSVIRAESNYNPYAISPKGAEGLMQLIPSTARQYGVRNSFDPEQNIEGGIRYLKYLQTLFADERLVLAAYNAGEGAVTKYGWIPPYAETQDYVYKVGRYYGLAKREQGQSPKPAATIARPVMVPPVLQEFVDGEGRIHITLRQVNE